MMVKQDSKRFLVDLQSSTSDVNGAKVTGIAIL
jgi:hypothetical protein